MGRFSDQLAAARKGASLEGAEGRTSERRAIHKHAILHAHGRTQAIVIRDISAGGLKIQNGFGLIAGDRVKIELLTRRVFEGTIAWSVPPYCGLKFETALADDDPLLRALAL